MTKFLLLILIIVLTLAILLIATVKIMNPVANQNIEIPWDFPIFAILASGILTIISNQEDILYHLKNK